MPRLGCAAALFVVASTSWTIGQTPATYRFFNTNSMGKLGQRIVASGAEGYGVQFVGRCAGRDVAVLLKRDGLGARTYEFVQTSRYATFVKELNDAGSRGFRLIRGTTASFYPSGSNWAVVVARDADGRRFTYSGVQANDEGLKALVDGTKRGATVAAGIGDRFILEETQGGGSVSAGETDREYRILSTEKTSTLEGEIKTSASDGYRAIESALLRVVMARDIGTTTPTAEYRLIAMRRASTAERELQAAGAEGFHIDLVPECTNQEGMFVLQRSLAGRRFDYRIATLKEETADDVVRGGESNGFHVAVLMNELAVLERQLPD
ncbi:MAG: hypothetical protein ND807_13420 [Vicinamibacterales bacterium]|nr:hypothetical protein [Vicinamibacterales bacterium]